MHLDPRQFEAGVLELKPLGAVLGNPHIEIRIRRHGAAQGQERGHAGITVFIARILFMAGIVRFI